MSKWKAAGQMAVAMREAQREMEERRLHAQQFQESVKNGTILRSLKRQRDNHVKKAKASAINYQRWCKTVEMSTRDPRDDAAVASSTYFQRQDEQHKKEIMNHISAMDLQLEGTRKTEYAIELIRTQEKETDLETHRLRRQLREQRFKLAQVRLPADDRVEGHMQQAYEQLGLQVAENRRLAQLIQHLETERNLVTSIHSTLSQELDQLSKRLGGDIEEAQSTYEQRDMNKRNMQKLKEHMAKSMAAHNNDMQSVKFKIDVLKRMETFMLTKNKFRNDEGKERRREKMKQPSCTERDTQDLVDLLQRVKSDLHEDDVQVIVNTFQQLETENFMLFTNISHVREGCHFLQMEVKDVKKKVAEHRSNKQNEVLEAKARKEELCEKISICRTTAEKKEDELRATSDVVDSYIHAVTDMLTKLNYNNSDITRLAGVYKRIEDRNIGTFMSEIEAYVNQLYILQSTMEFHMWRRARRMSLSGVQHVPERLPARLAPQPRVLVVPPNIDDLEQSGEEPDDPQLEDSAGLLRPLELWQIEEQLEKEQKDSTDSSSDIFK